MHNIPEFTVGELSRHLKRVVEDNFGYVRIKGEISGFKTATSGHLYFSLKDENSIISAVCFRNMASLINFEIADGLEVIASGKVTIYEGRSNYQIIVEKLEIAGIGAILAEIEQRRLRLLEQGYFSDQHKKTLPFLPKTIGVITSPTGAAIEDIINRISARFPTHLLIYPALMQGKNSASEVIFGIKYFNELLTKPDVIIIARGGGSFEDLLPFNDENLVKAVFNSAIPIISAVGHETDTTLIDYVSDIRAPTPTAAAEMAVPVLSDLQKLIDNFEKRLSNYFDNFFNNKQNQLASLAANLLHPKQRLENLERQFSQLNLRLKNNCDQILNNKSQYLKMLESQILRPSNQYNIWHNKIDYLTKNLESNFKNSLEIYQNQINSYQKLLISYDYKNVLARGYAVVRSDNKIVSNKNKLQNNQEITIEVQDGTFTATTIIKNS